MLLLVRAEAAGLRKRDRLSRPEAGPRIEGGSCLAREGSETAEQPTAPVRWGGAEAKIRSWSAQTRLLAAPTWGRVKGARNSSRLRFRQVAAGAGLGNSPETQSCPPSLNTHPLQMVGLKALSRSQPSAAQKAATSPQPSRLRKIVRPGLLPTTKSN